MLAACTNGLERISPSQALKDDGTVKRCNFGLVVDPYSAQEAQLPQNLVVTDRRAD